MVIEMLYEWSLDWCMMRNIATQTSNVNPRHAGLQRNQSAHGARPSQNLYSLPSPRFERPWSQPSMSSRGVYMHSTLVSCVHFPRVSRSQKRKRSSLGTKKESLQNEHGKSGKKSRFFVSNTQVERKRGCGQRNALSSEGPHFQQGYLHSDIGGIRHSPQADKAKRLASLVKPNR